MCSSFFCYIEDNNFIQGQNFLFFIKREAFNHLFYNIFTNMFSYLQFFFFIEIIIEIKHCVFQTAKSRDFQSLIFNNSHIKQGVVCVKYIPCRNDLLPFCRRAPCYRFSTTFVENHSPSFRRAEWWFVFLVCLSILVKYFGELLRFGGWFLVKSVAVKCLSIAILLFISIQFLQLVLLLDIGCLISRFSLIVSRFNAVQFFFQLNQIT